MTILLHICCAPCAIHPLRVLREEGFHITGLYYNPNIHPYREYLRRWEALDGFAREERLEVAAAPVYELETFLRMVVFKEDERCRWCYELRLRRTAAAARDGNYGGFSTTLLYSKYQKHDWIRDVGERLAREYGVPFLYRDFRLGWEEGERISRARQIYRQPYCGCIYSEKERYAKKRPIRRGE
ncbi:MAG: epoxyqueuosine reductase QueH [Pseudomonadota bacterium]|nr:epoxyqueuosine reductase QueH [Pseudomonadota bacterium]